MKYRKIISDSWEFTRNNKKLIIWYGFIPSILTTLVGILYLTYQFFAFKKSELFENANESYLSEVIRTVLNFIIANKDMAVPLIIIAIVIGLLYLFIPIIAQGGLIQIIARIKNGQKVKVSDGISYGLLSFLPLFEYHAIVKTFSLLSLLFQATFILRNLGPDTFSTFLPLFIIIGILGIFLSLLFTYAEYFIVIDKLGVFDSMTKSAKLVILNLKHTILIGILMLIITIRIFINAIIVLAIPAIIFVTVGYFATIMLTVVGTILGGLISLAALLFSAYFAGTLEVFASTVWVITFLELTVDMDKSAREKG